MIDPELLKMMCCPETHQPLTLAPSALVERLNTAIQQKQLRNRNGQPILEIIDGGLLREDGQFLYPIRQSIPIMLIEEAIPIEA